MNQFCCFRLFHKFPTSSIIKTTTFRQISSSSLCLQKLARNSPFSIIKSPLSFNQNNRTTTTNVLKSCSRLSSTLFRCSSRVTPSRITPSRITPLRTSSAAPRTPMKSIVRLLNQRPRRHINQKGNQSTLMLMAAVVVIVLGSSYAAVPLYRIYCQKTGRGGKPFLEADINERVANLEKVSDRKLKILFEADKSSRLAWDFKPSQRSIVCSPGETVLAFYTAKNHLDRPVNGIATYTILPYEAGKYFNKIQCFCFEEQQLNADEEVDLPVFFYIDPEYSRDPYLFDSSEIILSYNFFETKEGYKLPRPDSYRAHYPSLDSKKSLELTPPTSAVAGTPTKSLAV